MPLSLPSVPTPAPTEDMGDYVAQLQLHMTLQARNLVPSLHQDGDRHRLQLLQETQALTEKWASRQGL